VQNGVLRSSRLHKGWCSTPVERVSACSLFSAGERQSHESGMQLRMVSGPITCPRRASVLASGTFSIPIRQHRNKLCRLSPDTEATQQMQQEPEDRFIL
jgi:hypothetical protein